MPPCLASPAHRNGHSSFLGPSLFTAKPQAELESPPCPALALSPFAAFGGCKMQGGGNLWRATNEPHTLPECHLDPLPRPNCLLCFLLPTPSCCSDCCFLPYPRRGCLSLPPRCMPCTEAAQDLCSTWAGGWLPSVLGHPCQPTLLPQQRQLLFFTAGWESTWVVLSSAALCRNFERNFASF